MQRYGHGWYGETERHSLARLGIKTAKYAKPSLYNNDTSSLVSQAEQQAINTRKERVGFTKIEYAKLDHDLMKKLREFMHKKFDHALKKSPHVISTPEAINAHEDIKNVKTWDKFKVWFKKHEKVIALVGLGGALSVIAPFAGVPTIMQNVVTGEIIYVGGTALGNNLVTGTTVLTGMGVAEEVKIIGKDTNKQFHKENMISPSDINIQNPEDNAYVIKVKSTKSKSSQMATEDDYDSSEYGDLAKMSSPPIPISKLDVSEKKVLNNTIIKIKKLFSDMGKDIDINKNNFQIVKRVGVDDSAWGGHQDGLIQIDRDILNNPDKLEGVLTHELIHKEYKVSDKTRDLENLQMDIIGKLM